MSKSGRVWLGGSLCCLAAIPAQIQLVAQCAPPSLCVCVTKFSSGCSTIWTKSLRWKRFEHLRNPEDACGRRQWSDYISCLYAPWIDLLRRILTREYDTGTLQKRFMCHRFSDSHRRLNWRGRWDVSSVLWIYLRCPSGKELMENVWKAERLVGQPPHRDMDQLYLLVQAQAS